MNARPREEKVKQLSQALRNCGSLLVVMQDHPDPDALASAAGLRAFANALGGVTCSLGHGGIIGRAENRALARYLNLNLRALERIEAGRFDRVALVDTQPGTGNNSLPEGVVPDIVIDHHPVQRATRSAGFTDIRSRYGATATILYEYLDAAGVNIGVRLATALLYGIRSDTQDLGRETTEADIAAFTALYPRANKRMLSRIERVEVPDTYFKLLFRALKNAEIHGRALVAGIGRLDNPDMIGELADLLLRREDTDWALCYGLHQGSLLFSVRSSDPGRDAGKVAVRTAGPEGFAGGHNAFAAGKLPLTGEDGNKPGRIVGLMVTRFRAAVGVEGTGRRPLVGR